MNLRKKKRKWFLVTAFHGKDKDSCFSYHSFRRTMATGSYYTDTFRLTIKRTGLCRYDKAVEHFVSTSTYEKRRAADLFKDGQEPKKQITDKVNTKKPLEVR